MSTSTHRELTVADLMSTKVFAVTAGQSMSLAETAMRGIRVRHIPVVDGELRLVGLITHRDLLTAKSEAQGTADERSEQELAVPVAKIMQTAVWTVAPETPAVNAARLLEDHRFGCLPVVEDGKLVGIVTEHDFLRLVTDSLDLGPPMGPLSVDAVMSPLPVTVRNTDTLAHARDLMDANQIRHLPIVDHDGAPVGVVSDRDLQVAEAVVGRNSPVTVGLLGSERPYTVNAGSALGPVLLDLAAQRIGSALVVDEGRLTGILTTTDVCHLLGKRLLAQSAGTEG